MQVKQHVGVADHLLEDYDANVQRILRAEGDGSDDVDVLRGQLERVYANVWEQLDAAAAVTRAAGRSTSSYEEIRTDPRLTTFVAVAGLSSRVTKIEHGYTRDKITTVTILHDNRLGLELARSASVALKAQWPEVDWTPAKPRPEDDLRPRGLGGLFARLLGR